MHRTLLIILVIIFSFSTHAQELGISGGVNLSQFNESFSNPNLENDFRIKVGYQFGLLVNFEVAKDFSIRPGFRFTSKGASLDSDNLTDDEYARQKLTYFEIPLNFIGQFDDHRIYAGPYISFGIGGVTNIKEGIGSQSYSVEFVKEATLSEVTDRQNSYVKNIDAGFQIGMARRFSQLEIFAEFSLGLVNMTPKVTDAAFDPNDLKTTNQVISIGMTYYPKPKS